MGTTSSGGAALSLELWAGFGLGLVGSGHCLVMCGPLALSVPSSGRQGASLHLSRLAYNLGRATTYGGLGLLFGTLGQSLAIAGLQRALSVVLGLTLLVLAIARGTRGDQPPKFLAPLFAAVQQRLVHRLHRNPPDSDRSDSAAPRVSPYTVGLLNGLLPCGLVWAALTAATALGSATQGALFMILFGLGTLPALFGLATFGHLLAANVRGRLAKATPVALVVLGLLLVARGLFVHTGHAMCSG